jgi:hypothetical protein
VTRRLRLICCFATLCAACSPDPQEAPAAEPAAPVAAPTTQPADEHAHPAAAEATAPPTAPPPVPEGAKVAFVSPSDGAVVKGALVDGKIKVQVRMAAEGIAVKPAGPIEAGSGHHHILIDTEPTPTGMVVPADDTHLHFGQAQTEAELTLTPGDHTLTLQFADGIHRSYGPALSSTIKLTVEAESGGDDTTGRDTQQVSRALAGGCRHNSASIGVCPPPRSSCRCSRSSTPSTGEVQCVWPCTMKRSASPTIGSATARSLPPPSAKQWASG